jgi:hypothetical protein
MLQVFHLDVAKVDLDVVYVVMAIHVCSRACFKCFICFQTYVAKLFHLDVPYGANGYVASVCFECFICFRCMLQFFI